MPQAAPRMWGGSMRYSSGCLLCLMLGCLWDCEIWRNCIHKLPDAAPQRQQCRWWGASWGKLCTRMLGWQYGLIPLSLLPTFLPVGGQGRCLPQEPSPWPSPWQGTSNPEMSDLPALGTMMRHSKTSHGLAGSPRNALPGLWGTKEGQETLSRR